MRQAVIARSAGNYMAMMRTAIVCRRLKWVGDKDGHEVEEYEIDTAAVEALNSIEKQGGDGSAKERQGSRGTK